MNYTTGKYFLDTNFLIYLFSKDEPDKKAICENVFRVGKENAVFTLSTQVIKEFTHVMLGKFKADPQFVKLVIEDLEGLEIVQIDTDLIKKTIDNHVLYRYSFWDSMIITAAHKANCSVLLTEDLQHGQRINNLLIHNPFA
ncbi:MAG: PIN domain-containing protein [Saprospiraceae bacterium]